MNAAAEALGRCHFMQFCNGYDIMENKRRSYKQTPWIKMVTTCRCHECDRILNCTHNDLLLCYWENVEPEEE